MIQTRSQMPVRCAFVAILSAWILAAPTASSCAESVEPGLGEFRTAGPLAQDIAIPAWYAQTEALWLTRNRPNAQIFSAIDATGLGDLINVQDARDLDFNYEPGVRLTIGRRLDACNRLELSYFGLQDFHSVRQVTDPNNGLISVYGLNGPFLGGTTGFDSASVHRLEYDSELHNAEFNFRHRGAAAGPLETDLLLGFRYLGLNERFLFTSVQPGGGIGGVDAYGISENRSFNSLLGAQLGGELLYHATPRLDLTARANAGLFLNFARQSSVFIQDLGNIVRADYPARKECLAGLIQVGLAAQYRLGQHVALRGGYDVILLSGVALASSQFDRNSGYFGRSIDHSGTVVYHGPSAGLEIQW